MNFIIRRARHSDAEGIINAHRRSIREICNHDYSKIQIEAWAGRDFKEERWHQSIEEEMVWVISDDKGEVFGFGHLQLKANSPANLAGLYFVPEATGLGLGRRLVAEMFAECEKRNIREVHLTATKTAKKFYEKMGFEQAGAVAQIKMGDQTLDCFKMSSKLNSGHLTPTT